MERSGMRGRYPRIALRSAPAHCAPPRPRAARASTLPFQGGIRKNRGRKQMKRTKPPFRADHVGSILRSAPIKDARAKREAGAITAAQLKQTEDREIEKIIKKQEEVGLQSDTDGEYRRAWWHFDFFEGLTGVEGYTADHGIQFHGVQTKPRAVQPSTPVRPSKKSK